MRLSQFWLATLREVPAEAEIISHQLMLRAGMIRQTALGVYSWLPLGLRVLKKVEQVVREEINKTGAQELLMPIVQPAHLWQESGRWQDYGDELRRLVDRHKRDYCLGPTHEEVITDLVRRDLRSYKQLPINLYQIQTKFRDEIRPRFGVMRSREFMMKDAYSFHLNEDCLQKTYDAMFDAYCRIFDRLGLKYRAVLADNGAIGGTGSHEFHVLAETGEDYIVFAQDGDYSANLEKATAQIPVKNQSPKQQITKIFTPNTKTIDDLVKKHQIPIEKTLKTLLVKGVDRPLVALVLRGDHQLNVIKAEQLPQIKSPLEMADEKTVEQIIGAGFGSLGVVGLKDIPIIADHSASVAVDFVVGANQDDYHYQGANWEIDCNFDYVADLRNVVAGDVALDGKSRLDIARGIEVGHIFQLGDKYSKAMNLQVLLENGGKFAPIMGCYGIGVSRIVAAAIEQNNDERGIIWPDQLAPFKLAILPVNGKKSPEVWQFAVDLYQQLLSKGVDVCLDDRDKRAGVMFADMDLIGIPHRLVVSEKHLANKQVEYKSRQKSECQLWSLDQIFEYFD